MCTVEQPKDNIGPVFRLGCPLAAKADFSLFLTNQNQLIGLTARNILEN